MQMMISLNADDYPKYETYRMSSKEYAEEVLRMLESPVYSDKIRTEYSPLHDEYIFYTRREMNRVPHPRFGKPCENCGANDWKPQFKRIDPSRGHKLTHYICEYCGTRRNEYELHSM